ncbi:putative oxidoreductase [Lewinella marina]|uniref:DoxX family protein n=1 Tax=Neolewinella marina TaxID=438751 RepID=A0A2G0CG31_9BACT|nr:DoxX family protein [Neolewinella marina]NJB86604.1 putative oxidoreductase [Neolewinella marina]PHK98945.1 DoxX family protein [Neolewinella marina]
MTKGNIDIALLVLRLWFGLEMAFGHGLGKMLKIFAGDFKFGDPLGLGPATSLVLAGSAEFIAGILIAVGFFTRLATVPYIFTMLVAAFLVHYAGGDPWGRVATPLHYAVAATAILIAGPGRYSLDHKLFVEKVR